MPEWDYVERGPEIPKDTKSFGGQDFTLKGSHSLSMLGMHLSLFSSFFRKRARGVNILKFKNKQTMLSQQKDWGGQSIVQESADP